MQFSKINTNMLIAGGVVIGLGYWFFKKASNSDTIATLKEGLTHPLDALLATAKNAVGIDVTVKGGTELTENYNYYILLNGGMDKYISDHQKGTWTGAPYYPEKDYKTLYFNKTAATKPIFSL